MEFELTKEIVDQIIFAMEDQTGTWVVDGETGKVIQGEPAVYPEPRHVQVPAWRPTDGYLLMERFVARLRNPVLGEELRLALGAGKGVFRSFKDALRRYPEIARRWYLFKERSMRQVVHEWYNQMREIRGLERLSLEPQEESEDLAELVESDFVFTTSAGRHTAALAAADREAFGEIHTNLPAEAVDGLYERRGRKYPGLESPETRLVVAEDQSGRLAGFVWAVLRHTEFSRDPGLRILQLWVSPVYRGIGIGSALLRRLLDQARADGVHTVLVELGSGALSAAQLFRDQRFDTAAQLLVVDVEKWSREQRGMSPGLEPSPGPG